MAKEQTSRGVPRRLCFVALVLTLGVCDPIAAQTPSPFADLSGYFPPEDAIFASVSSTPPNAPAVLAQAAVDSEPPVVSLSALSSRVKPGDTFPCA